MTNKTDRKIVLLEGGEGVGKTTLGKALERDFGFTYLKFPTPNSPFEGVIFSKEAAVPEKAAAASLDFAEVLRKHLDKDTNIVMDRGPVSTIAYQSPQLLYDMMTVLDMKWTIDFISDIFILDVDAETGLSREDGVNAVSAAGLEFHKEVNARMRDFATVIGPDFPEETGYKLESETLVREWINGLDELPWPKNISLIDTRNNTIEDVYVILLEKLGLGTKAGRHELAQRLNPTARR